MRSTTAAGNLMQPSDVLVRDALETDIDAVQRIYAHHVRCGLATFEELAPSREELLARRAAVIVAGLPYLVAERHGEVIGYAYAGAYHSRSAYRYSIEDSVYVLAGIEGQGIGSALLQSLVTRCDAGPWRQMIALIGGANVASIALHRRMGFRPVGTLGSVGFKLGRWVDVVLMQRPLGAGDRSAPADYHPGGIG